MQLTNGPWYRGEQYLSGIYAHHNDEERKHLSLVYDWNTHLHLAENVCIAHAIFFRLPHYVRTLLLDSLAFLLLRYL